MAHYPNNIGEFKTKRVETRWYPSDLLEIDRQAKLLNLSRTDYITRCVLNKPEKKQHIFKVNWQTYRVMSKISRELNKIGKNINQIAKVFNSERLEGGKVPADYPLPEELSAIRTYISEVALELDRIKRLIVARESK